MKLHRRNLINCISIRGNNVCFRYQSQMKIFFFFVYSRRFARLSKSYHGQENLTREPRQSLTNSQKKQREWGRAWFYAGDADARTVGKRVYDCGVVVCDWIPNTRKVIAIFAVQVIRIFTNLTSFSQYLTFGTWLHYVGDIHYLASSTYQQSF